MVEKNIRRIKDLGVGIEIYINNNTIEEIDKDDLQTLSKILDDHGILRTVHAPFMDLSPGGFDRTIRTISRDKIKKSVEAANLLRAKAVVCHPGYDKWRFDGNVELWMKGSIDTWTEVIKDAEKDVLVILENIFEEEPSNLIALFDYFRDRNLWFCFDSGHFNLFSVVPLKNWLLPLKDKIREMHLHDNHGKSDEHLPIGLGTFPFRELKTFIRHTKDILFTSEFHSESHAQESIKNLREFIS